MNLRLLTMLILLSRISSLTLQDNYKKIIHNTDPEARCLDRSPSFVYVEEGKLKDHIMLFFYGGGGGICK